ncbi:MAG: hypothetical protein AABW67_05455, partial [Nanoarchaeota archaeon]
EQNPQAYIDSCVKENVEEALGILMPNGGDITPQGGFIYKNIERKYLCYTSVNYDTCVNQEPLLVEHIQDEITNYISPKVEACFQKLKSQLGKTYEIEMSEMNITTKLQTKQVIVKINREFKMTKGESSKTISEFKSVIINPVYDLAKIAIEIASQESKYCNFEILGFMMTYPQYSVDKFKTHDSNSVYTIREILSNKNFIFAVRSCPMPGGVY